MLIIDVTDKKGTSLFSVTCYDKKVYNQFLKQFRKVKNFNVIERNK